MYKIFFEDRFIILIEQKQLSEITDIQQENIKGFVSFNGLQKLINEFERSSTKALVIYSETLNDLVWAFKACFKEEKAAGGLVKNSEGKYLFIWRYNKWDLPKGKVKKGEDKAHAAVREVTEECGISNPEIQNSIIRTYHTYRRNDTIRLKTTFWYEMIYNGAEIPVPQVSEDITRVIWFSVEEIESIASKNTFGSISEVLNKVFK